MVTTVEEGLEVTTTEQQLNGGRSSTSVKMALVKKLSKGPSAVRGRRKRRGKSAEGTNGSRIDLAAGNGSRSRLSSSAVATEVPMRSMSNSGGCVETVVLKVSTNHSHCMD